MEKTIREVVPEALVTPSLTLAATDTRHYGALSSQIFRFIPVTLTQEEIDTVHGTNERISLENYMNSVQFYIRLMQNSQ